MIDKARGYLGQTYVGFTIPGQCVAFFNQVVLDVTGVKCPIKEANNAIQILTANNTRPDLCVQVINNPNDPNQLPSVGDWPIFDSTWGNGDGHIVCAEVVTPTGFTAIEQNYVPNKVTRQTHTWDHVAGWIHLFSNENNNQGGNDVAEKINLDTDRILAHGVLGRNGKANRPNALNGGSDDWVGQDLTNAFVQNFFLSAEGRQWRDSTDVNSFNEMQRRYDALPIAEKAIVDLQKALANEQAKPPKEVIKEVEKIVIRYVDKPVEVIKEVEKPVDWGIVINFIRDQINKIFRRS